MPEYLGMVVAQREGGQALSFFSFAATANEILSWAEIQRTADVRGAAQRLKNLAHIKTIRAFIEASPKNIIPTAVTLAVRPGAFTLDFTSGNDGDRIRFAKLSITQEVGPNAEKAAVIVDGQQGFSPLKLLQNNRPCWRARSLVPTT